MARLLLCHPGADVSTADVYIGLKDAIEAMGHDLVLYDLSSRLKVAQGWLDYVYRRARRNDPATPQPTKEHVVLRASNEVITRALDYEVDGVLIISAMYLHPQAMVQCKRAVIPVGLVLTESPYADAQHAHVAALADVVWTNERASVPVLRQFNANTHYLAAAYDPGRHFPDPQPGDADVPAHDVLFVGTAFQERIDLLAAVDWTGIDVGLYGEWGALPSRHPLRKRLSGQWTDNARTAALYRRAKIGLNFYRTSVGYGPHTEHIAHAESLNPRAYELAACGLFQLSNHRAEAADVFGGGFPAFTDAADLSAQLRRWLADDEGRQKWAHAARLAVMDHTFAHRGRQIMAEFEPALNRRWTAAYG